MPSVALTINDADATLVTFKNEEGSGWLREQDWDWWRGLMSGDHENREKGRRHLPALRARAAALITQATPDDAEVLATVVYHESTTEWRRKHGVGRVKDQWVRHLPIQHYIGTVALFFIPTIGPFLSSIAAAMTPMVLAASKKAIAEHESENTSDKFREDYYRAMDDYMNGRTDDLPVQYLEYHAQVVVPASQEVKEQLMSGEMDTETGSYSLDENGLARWRRSRENPEMPRYLAWYERFPEIRESFVFDVNYRPGKVAAAAIVGLAVGVAGVLILRGAA